MPHEVYVASSCAGKKTFDSFALASRIAARSRRRGGRKSERLAPYHCRLCGSWHVGSGR